jgi:uncharacterized protein YihD (DUF1040 family)
MCTSILKNVLDLHGSRWKQQVSYNLPDYMVSKAESAMKISNLSDSIIIGNDLLTQSCKKKVQ